MNKQQILTFLQENPFLDNLSPANLERLSERAECVTIPADTQLLVTGEEARYLSIIVDGKVHLGITKNGELTIVDILQRHRIIGWSAVIPPFTWSFDATAAEEVQLVRFDGQQLRRVCEEDAIFGVQLMTCMVKAVTRRLNATRASLLDHYC